MEDQDLKIVTPARDAVIWRYMDLLQFLTMLKQHALYFALLSELDDLWEASLSERIKANLMRANPNLLRTYNVHTQHMAINCWHENESESAAMWSLYTSESHGIAVRTTVGRLMASLRMKGTPVFIARVVYKDHDRSNEEATAGAVNAYVPAFRKRECYRHESEVRALAQIKEEQGNFRIQPPKKGVSIGVDLQQLVQRVIVSASFPVWGLDVVKDAMERAGLELGIETSAMLLRPA